MKDEPTQEQIELSEYPVVHEIVLNWGEMDAYHHINNTRIFHYFEASRIEFFRKLGLWEDFPRRKIGVIVAQAECKYLRPMHFPDTIQVGVGVGLMENYRFVLDYKVCSLQQRAVTAVGKTKMVFFDFNTNSMLKIPTDCREALNRAMIKVEGNHRHEK